MNNTFAREHSPAAMDEGAPQCSLVEARCNLVTLSDGADLLITDARFADRTGHVYPNLTPIPPDTFVAHTTHLPPGQPWHPTAPVEALKWLADQPSCTARPQS